MHKYCIDYMIILDTNHTQGYYPVSAIGKPICIGLSARGSQPLGANVVISQDAVFIISVAARLVRMHPSTLRKYERYGLLDPSRSDGNLRLYSARDLERLHQIKYLVEVKGVNLAGVEMALSLTERLAEVAAILRGIDNLDEPKRALQLVEEMLHSLGAARDTLSRRQVLANR